MATLVPVFLPGESPGDRGARQATASMGPKLDTAEQLGNSTALNCLRLQGQNWKKGAERATSQGCSANVQMYRPGSTLHRGRLSRSSNQGRVCFLLSFSINIIGQS